MPQSQRIDTGKCTLIASVVQVHQQTDSKGVKRQRQAKITQYRSSSKENLGCAFLKGHQRCGSSA